MGENRVPAWYAATGLHAENDRVYASFQELLHQLPMSYTELAARIGVSQPAVSRWASDVSHPSLDEMSAAYAAVESRLGEIRDALSRFGEVLRLIDEALRLYESLGGRETVRVQFDETVRKAAQCNLIEDTGKAVAVTDNGFGFDIEPFQIKSFRVWLAR